MTYVLGARSLANLEGVSPNMIAVAKLAITLTTQDFGFTAPQVRTAAEEEALIAAGDSTTMHSHHIPGPEGKGPIGFGGAVDAVPWDGAQFVWEWPRIYEIAKAFKQAFAQLGIKGTWGGVWDKTMDEYDDPETEEQAYIARQHARGNSHVFVDGPHFEEGVN